MDFTPNRCLIIHSSKLRFFLSQIFVDNAYKCFTVNAVNHTRLFQRLHLCGRSAYTVHSSPHQKVCNVDVLTEHLAD